MWIGEEAQEGTMTAVHMAINDYLVALAAEGKARRTVEVYGARLRHFSGRSLQLGKTRAQQS